MEYCIVRSGGVNGDWITLIHGFGVGSGIWGKQVDFLKEKYNLLLIDLPSHGNSSRSLAENYKHNFLELASAVNEIFMKEYISRSHFLCLSLGTIVAQAFDYLYPSKTGILLLCGAVSGLNLKVNVILGTLPMIRKVIPYRLIYMVSTRFLLPGYKNESNRKELMDNYIDMSYEDLRDWSTMKDSFLALQPVIITRTYKKFYIMGKRDVLFFNETLRQNVSNKANMFIIEKAGHICSFEKDKEFNNIIFNILG